MREREQTRETNEQTEREREREQHSDHQAKAAGSQYVSFDLGDKDTGPKQFNLSQYPQEQFGMQKRAFQQNWFQSFKWLEYCSRTNAAFCFACRVFGKKCGGRTGGICEWWSQELEKGTELVSKNMKPPSHTRTVSFAGTATKKVYHKAMFYSR